MITRRYSHRGAHLLHRDRIDFTPPPRIVEAALMGNSDALHYLGRPIPPPVSGNLLRRCAGCSELWPAAECDRYGLCPHCSQKRFSNEVAHATANAATHKLCRKCHTSKSRSEYTAKADAADGLHPYCHACRRLIEAEGYQHRKRKLMGRKWRK